MDRHISRLALGIVLGLAIAVGGDAFLSAEGPSDPAWATVAGVLAVITSAIAAWGMRRVVELEEDKRQPFPNLHFDVSSRVGLVMLRLSNDGGGVAHDISVDWDQPLEKSDGNAVTIGHGASDPQISILFPGQSIVRIVDGAVEFFSTEKKHRYTGVIRYQDASNRALSHRFVLDASGFYGSPYFENESNKALADLQKVPDELEGMRSELAHIRHLLRAKQERKKESARTGSDEGDS